MATGSPRDDDGCLGVGSAHRTCRPFLNTVGGDHARQRGKGFIAQEMFTGVNETFARPTPWRRFLGYSTSYAASP
jgi:hypothetical protein